MEEKEVVIQEDSEEAETEEPTKTRKIAAAVLPVAVGILIDVVASVVSNKLGERMKKMILSEPADTDQSG
jgi:hypothetical protein